MAQLTTGYKSDFSLPIGRLIPMDPLKRVGTLKKVLVSNFKFLLGINNDCFLTEQ